MRKTVIFAAAGLAVGLLGTSGANADGIAVEKTFVEQEATLVEVPGRLDLPERKARSPIRVPPDPPAAWIDGDLRVHHAVLARQVVLGRECEDHGESVRSMDSILPFLRGAGPIGLLHALRPIRPGGNSVAGDGRDGEAAVRHPAPAREDGGRGDGKREGPHHEAL